MQYIEPVISVVLLLAYIFIAVKQGRYIKILKDTNTQIEKITTVQSSLIRDFETYRKLFNMDDFEDHVKLKLDNQQLTLSKQYSDKEKTVVQEYLDKLKEEEKKTTQLSERTMYYEITATEMRHRLTELQKEKVKDTEQLKASQEQFHMMDQTAMHLITMLEKQSEARGLNSILKDSS